MVQVFHITIGGGNAKTGGGKGRSRNGQDWRGGGRGGRGWRGGRGRGGYPASAIQPQPPQQQLPPQQQPQPQQNTAYPSYGNQPPYGHYYGSEFVGRGQFASAHYEHPGGWQSPNPDNSNRGSYQQHTAYPSYEGQYESYQYSEPGHGAPHFEYMSRREEGGYVVAYPVERELSPWRWNEEEEESRGGRGEDRETRRGRSEKKSKKKKKRKKRSRSSSSSSSERGSPPRKALRMIEEGRRPIPLPGFLPRPPPVYYQPDID